MPESPFPSPSRIDIITPMTADEFRTGAISLPGGDLDDLPPCCLECRLLLPKEFSVGDGLVYYFCGYLHQDAPGAAPPPCLKSEPA